MSEYNIAEVAVSGTTYSFDRLFSYFIPEEGRDNFKVGCRVIVPFGRGDKQRLGMVMGLKSGSTAGLKEIITAVDTEPVLSGELMRLALYLREFTFCTYFDAIKVMLPPGMNILIKDNSYKAAIGDSTVKMVRLSDAYADNPENFKVTPKQLNAAKVLGDCGELSAKEFYYLCGVTADILKRMISNGIVEDYECEVLRNVDTKCISRNIDDVILSSEQQTVYESVARQIELREPECFLLHGVTGSGKTSVFEKLIHKTVSSGRQALMLIPEIALTPQALRLFKGLFGESVAVIHSSLSLGQRLDEYKRIKRGEAQIVIGTRSAVFAPLKNIGLIVMDEEGERSYKSESSPRYNTLDVAKRRCIEHGAVLLLASATPTVESYYNAKRGKYKLLELKQRYNSCSLPEVSVIDMNLERDAGNSTEFSRELVSEINSNLRNGEQTILLLNRRGYHTVISCCDCNKPVYCPNCSVPVTYHKANGLIMCHYCGYSDEPVTKCGFCGSEKLRHMGFGTQKLEEEVEMFFPNARILRMDADTTFSRYAYEKGFDAFAKGEYDIMLGTQMISKGLDFPNVTLVGVLSVDKALYAGDFRSYERTFSLITQVVGRGGRGDKKGRAYLQTFMPDHYVMNLAAKQDYKGFFNEEITSRRTMLFPPICDICELLISDADEETALAAGDELLKMIKERMIANKPSTPVKVLGPVRCSYGKINGKFRYRIIVKCKNTAEIRSFISRLLTDFSKIKEYSKVAVYADNN